jgi:predicted nucleic acid-binding protein
MPGPIMDFECFTLYLDSHHHHVLRHAVDSFKQHGQLRSTAFAVYYYLQLKSLRTGKLVDEIQRKLTRFDIQPFDLDAATIAAAIQRNYVIPASLPKMKKLSDERTLAAAIALHLQAPVATVQPEIYRPIANLRIEDWGV